MQEKVAIRRSKRSKYLRLTVYPGGKVVLSAPLKASHFSIESFLEKHAGWLKQKIDKLSKVKPVLKKRFGRAQYLKHKEEVRALVKERLKHFNSFYSFNYKKVYIRNQKTCWGSCSSRGNLSFNVKIILLPEELQDYIIVHELCHLKELNHSKKFWLLVEKTIPNYHNLRKQLKSKNLIL